MEIDWIHNYGLDINRRIIYLHGEPRVKDEEPGVDYQMASKFIKNIHILTAQSYDPITIHMNTVGGEWAYGMAIYDAIKLCKCETTIIVHAWARSMSSIILQAATHRVMMPNACFMVHWGTSGQNGGHYLSVKSFVAFEETTEKIMLQKYAERCVNAPRNKALGLTEKEICEFIESQIQQKSDWWLTAQEAVELGFADRIGV